MSQIRVDTITDEAGSGPPNFPSGLTGAVPAASIVGALNATGSAPIFACRAWVNFNGTGVVAIRASGNVSSVTDNGTGTYTVNFTTAMPDANYVGVCTRAGSSSGSYVLSGDSATAPTTSSYRVFNVYPGVGNADDTLCFVAIFR